LRRKLDVVAEYDAAVTGEKGSVLHREGLYSGAGFGLSPRGATVQGADQQL